MKHLIIILSIFISTSYGASTSHVNRISVDMVLICQSKGAVAYHSHECGGLKRCSHTISKVSKSEAIRMGLRACKKCYR